MGGKRSKIRQRLRRGGKETPHELASCYGKVRHATYEQAKAASLEKPHFVKPYKCQHCKFYHIGRRKSMMK